MTTTLKLFLCALSLSVPPAFGDGNYPPPPPRATPPGQGKWIAPKKQKPIGGCGIRQFRERGLDCFQFNAGGSYSCYLPANQCRIERSGSGACSLICANPS
ncbi:MAG: hypothetical protein EOP11_15930 [Proteobacteria bacterium]|nr:MAG: hypothetical protein EOP11_15930 [Pseudomonadota bacterium]